MVHISFLAVLSTSLGLAYSDQSWSNLYSFRPNSVSFGSSFASSVGGSQSAVSSAANAASPSASPSASATSSASAGTFTNPILQRVAADPWVVRHEDYYYMLVTTNDNVTILRNKILTDWNSAEVKLAIQPPENKSYTFDNWAPELHYFPDYEKWYIIYTADVDPDSPSPQQDMLCDYTW